MRDHTRQGTNLWRHHRFTGLIIHLTTIDIDEAMGMAGKYHADTCFAEPAACAVHTMDQLQLRFGDEVLVFGTGPTGIILIQLLLRSGAKRVVVCGPGTPKVILHPNCQ